MLFNYRRQFVFIAAALLAILFLTTTRTFAQSAPENEQPFTPTFEQIETAGQYDFVAQIEQTLIPRPVPGNIGTTEQRIDSQMRGSVVLPDYARIELQFEAATEMAPLALEQEGGKTFLIQNGERTEIENPLSVGPTTDFVGYLHAAKNVRQIENPERPNLTIYQFEIDGAAYGDYMRETIQAQLPPEERGRPMQTPAALLDMTGRGELWVDADGYPQRQILNINVPEINQDFDAQTHVVIDFDFETALTGVPLPTADEVAAVTAPAAPESVVEAETAASTATATNVLMENEDASMFSVALLIFALILVFAFYIASSHPWIRAAVPVGLSLALITTPILGPLSQAYALEKSAPALPSMTEALGWGSIEDDTEFEIAEAPQMEPNVPLREQNLVQNNNACGSGDVNTDTDLDGTNDFVELCLGTDPYYYDTDLDGITDTIEIEGFVYNNTTFYSNPHETDSNEDGLSDEEEWPAPFGTAPSIDPDGDNIPNLWDDDNDGDGVPDFADLAPFSATGYQTDFSFSSSLNGSNYNGYQYIEVQVRPEDESRLRMGLTTLDWPYDDLGSIQAHDVANLNELTFAPVLKVTTRNVPSEYLARDYGVIVQKKGNQFEVQIPLSPVTDGGNISAFQGRVAYEPWQINNINWSKIELVWVAYMENSEYRNGRSSTTTLPVAEYKEPTFQLTGVQVTKSADTSYAVIGTPGSQTDHRPLANLLSGLEASFLNSQAADIDEIVSRFNNDNTPLTQTWGVPAADVAVGTPFFQPRHGDEMLRRISNSAYLIREFLDDNNYDQSKMATVIMAIETQTGSLTMDDLESIDGGNITFNMADIPLFTMRSVNLSHYTHVNNVWGTPSETEAINTLIATYENDPESVLADLQVQYPDLTGEDLLAVFTSFYAIWGIGQVSYIDVDGVALVGDTVDDTVISDRFNLPTITDFLTYIIESNEYAVPGEGLVFSDIQTYHQYRNAFLTRKVVTTELSLKGPLLLYKGYKIYKILKKPGKKFAFRGFQYKVTSHAKKVLKLRYGLRNFGNKTIAGIKPFAKIGKLSKLLPATTKGIRALAKVATVLRWVSTAVLFAITIGITWATFANFESPFGYEKEYALAYAIADTIITVIYLVLSFIGPGIVLVFALTVLDLIFWAITAAFGFPIDSVITTAIAKIFANIDVKTKIDHMDFDGLEVRTNGNGYPMAGSTTTLSDHFRGRIQGYVNVDGKYLDQSDMYATLNARAGANITVGTGNDINTRRNRCYVTSSAYKYCNNELFATFAYQNAGRDQQLEIFYNLVAKTAYSRYTFGFRTDKVDTLYMPSELDAADRWDWVTIYMDVLPNTLDGLVGWNELTNYDLDGDDDSNASELLVSTIYGYSTDIDNDGVINSLDWDRDGDMLSDGFEAASQNSSGSDPNIYDTDGDGLYDGREYALNTAIGTADTDSDGLTDGEEVFHYNGSDWVGGGWMIDINGSQYWVFSDPLDPDSDNDGIFDGSEKANGTSPYGFNGAPETSLTAGPTFESPDGLEGVYVKSGDTVTATFDIYNIGGQAVDSTVSMCVPSSLTGVNVIATGDRVPATTQNNNCYEWDFSGNNLLLFQRFKVEMSGTAAAGTYTDTISVDVPYAVNGAAQPISKQILYVEDNTAPVVELTDPFDGTILNSQFYVVGGYASDGDSWVDRVEVTVPAGTFDALLTESQWGYTWDLPDDGVVTVSAIAYDLLGNASAPSSIEVTVDTLAPTITTNIANNATISAGESYTTSLPVSGTVTDNFAGLTRVQLRYNNGIWRTIWEDAGKPLSTNWSGLWELPEVGNSQGEHNLYLRAYDAFGNVNTITRTVFIDVLPPTNGLTNQAFVQDTPNHVPGGQTVPLYGVASDAGNNPLPADPSELSGNLNSITDATVWLGLNNLVENDGGAALTWVGDMNGDRLGDLAVGLPAANGGTGRVVVVNGRPGDWPIPTIGELELLDQNTPSYIGVDGAGIGAILNSAGDFNGDGTDDLLIGDPANERIFMILGIGSSGVLDQPLDGTFPRQIEINTTGTNESLSGLTATQMAGVGDVNNDGLSDMLVAVDGAVYLVVGTTNPVSPIDMSSLGAAVLETSSSNVSVGGVGDVNNDNIADFAIAVDGTVYLFAGSSVWVTGAGTALSTNQAMATFATSDNTPTIVSTGDVNGDGIADFAFTNSSSPTVIFGSGSASFGTQSLGGFASPLSGFLAAAGDVDKDGRGDLLIGNSNGDAYLIEGSNLNSVAATISGVDAAASTYYTPGADLAGDGSADLAVVPSASAATALGYNGFGSVLDLAPFISRSALPQAAGTMTAASTDTATQSRAADLLVGGDVTVAPAGGDYTSIQAAIDSGASRVLVQPGIYAEAITLTNDVAVIGSGADRTVLSFPGGSNGTTLVTVNGVSNAAVLNMTLLGSGTETGLAVSNGASNIELGRSVLEGFATAVSADGSATTLALKNNTIVGNVDGFVSTNNAGVNVRNTIFAYNTGTALQYQNGAVLKLHQYNLYYANGTDLAPNNPGGGEIFSNPLFLDYANGDFRTESFSPVIDAGTPNDPVPPGAGLAIDIGHREQTPSSFFTDDDYCDVCLNDGLIWGVDAFNTIQEAVDAAQEDIDNLRVDSPIQFTVGVNDGAYVESVVISSSVRLLGQAPDRTSIQGSGGPAVTFQAAVNAGVTGFALTGAGAEPLGILLSGGSNTIKIDYNLIKNNTVGISVTQRSTGNATFNTIIDNTTGVQLGRGVYAIQYTNPLLIENTKVFQIYDDECLDLNALFGYENVVCLDRGFLWLDTANNIVSGNTNGFVAIGGSVMFSDNNLMFNTTDYTNVYSGTSDIIGLDPLLTTDNGYLQVGSPALDQAPAVIVPPAGGGIRADLGWHELRAAPISVFMGQPDESVATESIGVGQVEYAVVQVMTPTLPITATLPNSWSTAALDNPGEKLTYWQVDYTPAGGDGYYRLYSRASDLLGNTETEVSDWYDGAFVVDSGAPVVTMTARTYGIPNWILIEAEVTDYIGASFDVDEIYVVINGERFEGRWNVEEWTADGSTPRTFRYFYQNTTGQTVNITYQAFAADGAGNVGSSAQESRSVGAGARPWQDTIEPYYITVTNPLPGQYIDTATYLFEGETWDIGAFFEPFGSNEIDSGTSGVELSFDGGVTWDAAFSRRTQLGDPNRDRVDRIWSYEWTVPENLDATTIPVRVRAIDNAGNFRSTVITVTVDTGAPREIRDYTYNWPIGWHVPDQPITVCYPLALDGSGYTERAGFTINDNEEITGIFPGSNPCATQLNAEGAPVGFNMSIIDDEQNMVYQEIGDWYGEYYGNNGISSIQRDGRLDIQSNEWVTTTEFLDDDERPLRTQYLWTSWDGYSPFIGWQGASWGETGTDGEMWVYFDIYSAAGTTQPVSGTVTLPFEADTAVHAFGTDSARQYNYNDGTGQWEFAWFLDNAEMNSFEPEYAHNPETGETEIRVASDIGRVNNVSNFDTYRMMLYAVDTSDKVWTTFPTANSLDGNFQYYYEWENVVDADDLRKLPTSARIPAVSLAFTSNPAEQDAVTTNNTITYVAALTSLEDDDEPGLQLQVNASAGLTYQTVTGAAAHNCVGASSCTVDVPTIPAGGTQLITITAVTAGNLNSIDQISTTIQLQAGLPVFEANASLTHVTDIAPPTVTIRANPGRAIGSGQRQVRGSASDGTGAGVAYVEVSTNGSTWQLASGTENWNLLIDTPSTASWTLYARAVDHLGQTSATATLDIVRDIIPPQITYNPATSADVARGVNTPVLVGAQSFAIFEGVAQDLVPSDAQVELLEAQFDTTTAAWESGNVYLPQGDGSQNWVYSWQLPTEDGVLHQVRFRATDYGGNSTTTEWNEVIVDTVAPAVTVDVYRPVVTEMRDLPAVEGTISDGYGVAGIQVLIYPASGAPIETSAALDNGNWSVMLDQPLGEYTLILIASDIVGNERLVGAYAVERRPFSNSAPVTVDDSVTTDVNVAVTIDVLANDTDAEFDILTINAITQGSNGTVVNNGSDITYTPNADFEGVDSFTYTIDDGFGAQATGTVTVTVSDINSAPLAVDDAATTAVNTAVTIDVLANDSDPDMDTLTIQAVTQGTNGSVVNNGTDVTYTPNTDFIGSDTFTYTVADGNGGQQTGTVTVNVVESVVNVIYLPLITK